jgi:hypothetical protein
VDQQTRETRGSYNNGIVVLAVLACGLVWYRQKLGISLWLPTKAAGLEATLGTRRRRIDVQRCTDDCPEKLFVEIREGGLDRG